MLVVGVWVVALLALTLAVLVFRRAQLAAASARDDDQPGLGKWLVPFVMVGMMSLRIVASLHRGAAVTLPLVIAAVSVVVLITFGAALRAD